MNTILPISEIAVVCGLIMTCSYLVYIEKFIFDGNKKLFIYQKSSFFIKSQYVYGKYSDIDAITISYFFNWENVKNAVMTVILKNGKMVETDIYNMKLYSKEFINDDGKELADSIGCRFIPGIPGKKVVPIMDADRTIYYEYEPVKKRY
ncbi:MAG: hypothetical protein M0R31_02960 [Candidatus Riflebacteria bacterium]|nr:hypothetical protein [Candidatus Riflebacteria bacterium]